MSELYKRFIDEQADREAELRDLRAIVHTLLRRNGGKITFKRSELQQTIMDSWGRPWTIVVDDIYDSVELRLDEERTVKG
jgi:hypothetical protein